MHVRVTRLQPDTFEELPGTTAEAELVEDSRGEFGVIAKLRYGPLHTETFACSPEGYAAVERGGTVIFAAANLRVTSTLS